MDKHLNVLFVEDSEDDAILLLREIKKGGYDPTFMRVETAEDMLACLNDQTWDVVISDYSLPEFSAPQALEVLQGTGLDLPFIIVSGKVEDDVAVTCMTAGAHDFVRKGNLSRLVPAIERELKDVIARMERKQAYETLEKSEQRLNRAQEIAHLADWEYDVESDKYIGSDESHRIFDNDPATELSYGQLREVAHPDDLDIIDKNQMSLLENGICEPFEYRIVCADGSIRHLYVQGEVERDSTGKITKLFGIIHDITEHKQVEEELIKYRMHLEELVKERTSELDEKNKELEQFNKLFVGRELKMIELKERIAKLEKNAEPDKNSVDKTT